MYRILRVIYPKAEKVCDETNLYFRGEGLGYSDVSMRFYKKSEVSLGTYFNSLPYTKLLKYTDIKTIVFRITVAGKAKIRLIRANSDIPELPAKRIKSKCAQKSFSASVIKYGTSYCPRKKQSLKNTNIKQEIKPKKNRLHGEIDCYNGIGCSSYIYDVLKEESFTCKRPTQVDVSVDISKMEGDGVIFAEIYADSGTILYGGEYLTPSRPKRTSKIGIIFCSYKKDEYIINSVKQINARRALDPVLAKKTGIFIVDNAGTLSNKEIANATIISNENNGGSGGFSRGIKEVCERREFTHFLIIDDGVVFETELLHRVLFWAENVKQQEQDITIAGGALKMHDKKIQKELSGIWTKYGARPNKSQLDVRHLYNVVRSEYEMPSHYATWYFCCMPVTTKHRVGLLLPFFLKGYDIEYALRSQNDILTTCGISVWHKGSSIEGNELDYYVRRNESIIEAIYFPKKGIRRTLVRMWKAVSKRVVTHRYQEVRFIFKGYDDYLKGPTNFIHQLPENVHSDLMKERVNYYTKEELKELGYDIYDYEYYDIEDVDVSRQYRKYLLNGYLIPRFMYPKHEKNDYRVVDISDYSSKAFYKADTVVQFNDKTGKGFVTKLKKTELFKAFFGLISRSIRIIATYHWLSRDYRLMMENFEKSTKN